jgi:4-aminobutyrate aminotransferase / (S)-3-amino-2-methylpropionate transaminase / 5-aminovalerate transaminase
MGSIRIRTEIPGPRSRDLMKRRDAAVPRALSHATPIFIDHALGATLIDVDGNRYIDFASGIGCINVGHRHSGVMQAIEEQLAKYMHTCVQVTPYEPYVRLAERMNDVTPGRFAKKTILLNTGAEAVENAVKIARAHTKRPAIIAFEDAFHGRTFMAMSLTSKTHPYKAGFEPFPGDVYRVPYAYCYRCPYSKCEQDCSLFCADQLEATFKRYVAAESVAAVIAEPVLGEGGFVAPPKDFFKRILEICRKRDILFIADEVQTGFGRTGTLFACEQYGIEPDLIVTAKSLGGGLPIAAVTGRSEIMDAPRPGGLGGTFAGNPVSCAAALAVLDEFDHEHLAARANQLGNRFYARASKWKDRWNLVGDVRGLGAMQAIELVRSREDREPADAETREIVQYCYEHGLIVLSAGTFGNVVRLLMPLVIGDEQFDEGLDVLEAAIAAVSAARTTQVAAKIA